MAFPLLLVAVFVLVLFFAILPHFLPGISNKVVELVVQRTTEETQIRQEIVKLGADLKEISMVDQFAKYAKTERRIIKLKDELTKYTKNRNNVALKMKLGSNIAYHVVQVVVFLSLIWSCRSMPLLEFKQDWFFPIHSIIAFPTGKPGALGVTFWILVCRSVVNKGMQWAVPA